LTPSTPRPIWLQQARRCPSPNQDERPPGTEVNLLVIHGISLPAGAFGGPWIEALFQNRLPRHRHPCFQDIHRLRVSSHLLIRRDGELIQFVPLERRAWHAGRSSFQGREACNDFSIGIELEGTDHIPYTDSQYHTLAATVARIRHWFPAITPERTVGHSDIAPGRKTDPGPVFDWSRLHRLLKRMPE